jgi:hypothetical protein
MVCPPVRRFQFSLGEMLVVSSAASDDGLTMQIA